MKKLMLTTALSLMMAVPAMAQTKAIIFTDGAQKEVTYKDYDMAPATALVKPEVVVEGYQPVTVDNYAQFTADKLDDVNVYGLNGEEIGEIDDIILTADGKVDRVVLEVGGFLGIGEREVAVPFDRMTIMSKDGLFEDFRVYVDSTQERLEALPEYEEIE